MCPLDLIAVRCEVTPAYSPCWLAYIPPEVKYEARADLHSCRESIPRAPR